MKSKDAITFRTRGVLFSIILFLLCSRTCSAATSRIGPSVEKLLVQNSQLPQLILISGCTGTGKSTFGMEVAIKEGKLNYRKFIPNANSVKHSYSHAYELNRSNPIPLSQTLQAFSSAYPLTRFARSTLQSKHYPKKTITNPNESEF